MKRLITLALLAFLLAVAASAGTAAAAETPCTTVCYVNAATGNDAFGGGTPGNPKKTIQAAIDTVSPGGTVRIYPGNYSETATNRWVLGINGPHQFGLFIDKNGVTLQGVDASDQPITSYANVAATITTNATNNFGYSGIFVQGDNVTIAGLKIGANTPSDNKTIEVIGDAFTLKNSVIDGPNSVVYDEAENRLHAQKAVMALTMS